MKDLENITGEISLLLKEAREGKALSVRDAASITGLSPSTIQRIEAWDKGVSLGTLFTYLSCLGLEGKVGEAISSGLKDKDRMEKARKKAHKKLIAVF